MNKIGLCFYRDWGLEIAEKLELEFADLHIEFVSIKDNKDLISFIENEKSPANLFFIGWSEIIEKEFVDQHNCYCLHPSLLPKFKGGSPFQNQMINGADKSGITIFKMDEYIDNGPIFYQAEFDIKNLELDDFIKLTTIYGFVGFKQLTEKIIYNNKITLNEQSGESSYFKRRTPSVSEITFDEIQSKLAIDLKNKVNSLKEPYPLAYISCKEGTKLYLKSVIAEE